MNKTYEEISEFFTNLITRYDLEVEDYAHTNAIDISIGTKTNGVGQECVTVEARREYYSINLTFANLKEVSEFFGTDKINIQERSEGGCESCDYGSSYGFDMEIWL